MDGRSEWKDGRTNGRIIWLAYITDTKLVTIKSCPLIDLIGWIRSYESETLDILMYNDWSTVNSSLKSSIIWQYCDPVLSSSTRSCPPRPGPGLLDPVLSSSTRSCPPWPGLVLLDPVMSSSTRFCFPQPDLAFIDPVLLHSTRSCPSEPGHALLDPVLHSTRSCFSRPGSALLDPVLLPLTRSYSSRFSTQSSTQSYLLDPVPHNSGEFRIQASFDNCFSRQTANTWQRPTSVNSEHTTYIVVSTWICFFFLFQHQFISSQC